MIEDLDENITLLEIENIRHAARRQQEIALKKGTQQHDIADIQFSIEEKLKELERRIESLEALNRPIGG